MSSLTVKRAVATALAGAAIASAIGATGALAMPMAPGSVDTAVEPQSVPPPPSSIAAPAGSAYEDLRGTAESVSVPPPPSSIAAPAGSAYEDLRSTGRPVSQPAREPQPVADEPGGFDLPSAAIGAVTAAGLLIGLLAVAGVVRRRPLSRGHGTIGA